MCSHHYLLTCELAVVSRIEKEGGQNLRWRKGRADCKFNSGQIRLRMSSSRCLMLQQILWVACLLATTNGFNPGSRINKHARSGNTIAPKCSPCALSLTSKSFNEFQANCRTDGLCGQRVIPNQLKLQHQRSPAVRVSRESSCKLMMTTTDSSNNVSNSSSNPFAKVWLWFKRLLAKIWVRDSHDDLVLQFSLSGNSSYFTIDFCIFRAC